MKSFLALIACMTFPLVAQDERTPGKEATTQPESHDQTTLRGLARLEGKLGVKFDRPFPVADFDCDVYRRQPIALLPIGESKVAITRPIMNPYDGAGTIEWMVGTENIRTLGEISLDGFVHLDAEGELIQISLLASPDGWSSETGTSQLRRTEGETGQEFLKRTLGTYRQRAQKAASQQQALLLLAGFEKVLTAIQQCRRDEAFLNP